VFSFKAARGIGETFVDAYATTDTRFRAEQRDETESEGGAPSADLEAVMSRARRDVAVGWQPGGSVRTDGTGRRQLREDSGSRRAIRGAKWRHLSWLQLASVGPIVCIQELSSIDPQTEAISSRLGEMATTRIAAPVVVGSRVAQAGCLQTTAGLYVVIATRKVQAVIMKPIPSSTSMRPAYSSVVDPLDQIKTTSRVIRLVERLQSRHYSDFNFTASLLPNLSPLRRCSTSRSARDTE
jgi:hypothetical protein